MSLEITFDETKFIKPSEDEQKTNLPDFKKFNMRFHNLDLEIIDAIAKRDGTSRSQIINSFIEEILKTTLVDESNFDVAEISYIAQKVDKISGKRNFSWLEWFANYRLDSLGYLENDVRGVKKDMNINEYSSKIKLLNQKINL